MPSCGTQRRHWLRVITMQSLGTTHHAEDGGQAPPQQQAGPAVAVVGPEHVARLRRARDCTPPSAILPLLLSDKNPG
jgi:hypothetical protein